MKASLLKILRGKESTGGRTNPNYKVISFIVCFLIALTLWFMNTLSKKYTENLTFGIEYLHYPQPKSSFNATDTLKLKVSSTGFRILAYKMGFIDKTIKMDVSQFKHRDNTYQYNMNNHIHETKVEEQLGDEVKLLDITPDTLFIRPLELKPVKI